MSPRSLDPISRRPDKSGDKPADAKSTTKPTKKDAPSIPHTADRDQMLAKAQANLRAKKDQQARGRRKVILALVIIGTFIFLGGATIIGWNTAKKAEQAKKAQQTKNAVISDLSKFNFVKNLTDDQKSDASKQAGAQYLAAQKIGIAPSSDDKGDQAAMGFMAATHGGGVVGAKYAIDTIINRKLEQITKDGYYEGYVYRYWYANTAIKWPSSFKVENRGSAEALEADRKYAFDTATADIKRLQDKQVTPDELIKSIAADNRLNIIEDPNGSGPFTSLNEQWPGVKVTNRGAIAINNTIRGMKAVGFSEIGKLTYISTYDKSSAEIDAGYFFVQMTKYIRGQAAVDAYSAALKDYQGQLQ